MANAEASIYDGTLVKAHKLLLAGEAHTALAPTLLALDLIRLGQRNGTLRALGESSITGSLSSVPSEICELIRWELVEMELEEASPGFRRCIAAFRAEEHQSRANLSRFCSRARWELLDRYGLRESAHLQDDPLADAFALLKAVSLLHVRQPRAESSAAVGRLETRVHHHSPGTAFASSGADLPSSFPANPPSYPRRINAFLSKYHISASGHTLPTLITTPPQSNLSSNAGSRAAQEGKKGEPRWIR